MCTYNECKEFQLILKCSLLSKTDIILTVSITITFRENGVQVEGTAYLPIKG